MLCFECSQAGVRSEAVAVCHHCSAALCSDHAHIVSDPVVASYPVTMTIMLPRQARLILCDTCAAALGQKREPAPSTEG